MAVNRKFAQSNKTFFLPTLTGLKSGDPVCVGQIPGVLLIDALAASPYNATIQMDGVFALSVSAAGAIAIGDILYYHAGSTPKINDTASGGIRFGYAMEAIASGTATIQVQVGY